MWNIKNDKIFSSTKRSSRITAKSTSYLIGNKIANKMTKVPKNSQQSNSEIVTNKHDKEIPKEQYIFSQKHKKLLIKWD